MAKFVLEDIQISPNPFQNRLSIEINSDSEIEIRTIQGELVYHTLLKSGSNTLDLTHLRSGVFYLSFFDRDVRIKLVKI